MDRVTMDLVILLGTAVGLFGTVVGLFIWNRSESREDVRMMMVIVSAIKDEIKDFHGRLCSIEEKTKNKEIGG